VTLGVVFSVLAAVVLNIGNLTQKHAFSSIPQVSGTNLVRAVLRSRVWMLGLMLCLLGLAFQIVAFAHAPLPVVQSIFNAGIVLLIVVSRLKLGERLHSIEWAGIGVVVVSLSLIAVSLGQSDGSIGLVDAWWRLLGAAVPTLLVVMVIVLIIRSRAHSRGFLFGLAAGLLYGAAALGTKGASTLVVRDGFWHSIPSIFTSVYPYVFLVFSGLGMVIYQSGLQRARISVVGTMSDVICSTYLVAIGMVVFGESLPQDPATLALRLGGFAGVLLGTVLVALGGPAGTEAMPPIESDLGLGPVLATEVDSITSRTIDSIVGS
jgi:multidrug transporter EmrE-like cation transporter